MSRLLAVLLSLVVSTAVMAVDSLRCGSRLVSLGDSAVKVRQLCGEPLAREVVATRTRHLGVPVAFTEITELVEMWTYEVGPTRFRRELTFSGGALEAIEFGDKP